MIAFPSAVQSSLGRTFHLGKQIGKGGEGAVYETKEATDIAIKLYWPNRAQSRRAKISAMAAAHWYKTTDFIAFPIDALFSPSGVFVGYLMKKVTGSKPVHMLYSPASRKTDFPKANYPFLVHAACNVARAVASVHTTGCIIGDINHSGFLVSNQAMSILIDSDSFQVISGNSKFLCQVGTPEYTPAELQGARFDHITRAPNHDNFGLAVLVFQLLFMGRHPFSGRYQSPGDMPLERAIHEYRFAYSAQTSLTKMQPPPGAPLLTDFPFPVGQAFEQSFGRAGVTLRTRAAEWVPLLERLEKELVQCSADSSHHHVKGKPCPWCRMEQTSPGFITFISGKTTVFVPTHIDISQLAALLRGIKDPGPLPNLQSSIVAPTTIQPAAPSHSLISRLRARAYLGIGGSGLGAILIFFGDWATLPGLIFLGGGILAGVLPPKELKRLRQERSQAETAWRSVEQAWTQHAGNQKFVEIKGQTDSLIRLLSDLSNEEQRQLKILEQKKHDAQLNRHLERFLIAHAKIRKIGSGRKAVLASFGIETAADINPARIYAIQGFGPTLVSELMAWRQTAVNKFTYNAAEPINPADLSALKSTIATLRNELDNKIRNSVATLQQASNIIFEQRKKLSDSGTRTFAALKQAEANEQRATGPLHKASQFISICCAVLAAIGLLQSGGQPRRTASVNNPQVATPKPPISQPPTQKQPSPPPARTVPPNINVPKQDSPDLNSHTNSNPPTSTSEPKSQIAQPEPSQKQPSLPPTPTSPPNINVSKQDSPDLNLHSSNQPPTNDTEGRKDAPPPLPPIQEIPRLPDVRSVAPQNDALTRDLSVAADATEVQKRLITLGFLTGVAEGKWGAQSKHALFNYKQQAGLEGNDSWDAATERSLFSPAAPHAVRTYSFIGGWTDARGQCGAPGESAPLRITTDHAETDVGECKFSSVQAGGHDTWFINATCRTIGEAPHAAHIRLTIRQDVMQWSSEQPTTFYYRCNTSR
jgi:DNA-binding helix-hairpin-helix protein with protein kinase domain